LPIGFQVDYIYVYGTSREIYSCTSFACKGGLGGGGVCLGAVVYVGRLFVYGVDDDGGGMA